MQENTKNTFYSYDAGEITTSKDIYVWAAEHTNLCRVFVLEHETHKKQELDNKLDLSLAHGKKLLDSLFEKIDSHHKPLIPISGINRFSKTKELLSSKEMLNKNMPYTYRAELGTSSSVKSIPLPSRTYLKKKIQAQ